MSEGIRLVYPYTPLEENLLDNKDGREQQGKSRTASSEGAAEGEGKAQEGGAAGRTHTTIGCAKGGLWKLRYTEKETAQEFMRFCHRGLDGAVVPFVYCISTIGTMADISNSTSAAPKQVSTVGYFVCLCLELGIHFALKAGKQFQFRHAFIRQCLHIKVMLWIMAGNSWNLQLNDLVCKPDPLYPRLHGGELAPQGARYRGCINVINPHSVVIVVMGLCSLRLDIYVHFMSSAVFTIALSVVALGAVEWPETEGLLWHPTPTSITIRILFALMMMVLSNLVAYAKHRSLQWGFESALEVHYQMRASTRKMETVDSLLSSMVPTSALGTLMAGGRVLDYSPMATVMFSDMVSFTRWSSVRNPAQVVGMLSVIIRDVDVLAADMEVSKIKTIGDCYWAVTGIPEETEDHACVMLEFAFAMLDRIRQEAKQHVEWDYPADEEAPKSIARRPVQFRTGIHSGPVQGGILGNRQVSYEIFGETSSLANRVEANGVPDQVTVSARTKRLLGGNGHHGAFKFTLHSRTLDTTTGAGASPLGETKFPTDPVDEDERHGKLFVVKLHADSDWLADSASQRSSRVSLDLQARDDAEERAREQRRRYVETHLLPGSNGGSGTASTGSDLAGAKGGDQNSLQQLSAETREDLIDRYSAKNSTFCVRYFAQPGFEEEFRCFCILQNMDLRLGGCGTLLVIFVLLFIFVLMDANKVTVGCLVFMLLGQACLAGSLCTLWARRHHLVTAEAKLQKDSTRSDGGEAGGGGGSEPRSLSHELDSDILSPNRMDYFGNILAWVGIPLWMLGAILTPDSLVTNNILYTGPVIVMCVLAPNNHIPAGPGIWSLVSVAFLGLANGLLKVHSVLRGVIFFWIGLLWSYMLVRMAESRSRIQFIERKVAAHFSRQQAIAAKAQQAVLTSMLPDFVIEPLTLWLSSNFDPAKAVVQSYEETCVAFVRMADGAKIGAVNKKEHRQQSDSTPVPTSHQTWVIGDEDETDETPATEMADWLFPGHLAIDNILESTKLVEKVKTVGDLVIIAGSFRGHSADRAAAALLGIVVRVHRCFAQPGNQNSVTIGLHAGPVMGIVLGFSRLSFDIFGDTVNTCSRVMTSTNAKGKITASREYLQHLPPAPFTMRHPTLLGSSNIDVSHGGSHKNEDQASIQSNHGCSLPTEAWDGHSIEYGPSCEVIAKGKGVVWVQEVQY